MDAGTYKKCTGTVSMVWRMETIGTEPSSKGFQRLIFRNRKVLPAFPVRLTTHCAPSCRRYYPTSPE